MENDYLNVYIPHSHPRAPLSLSLSLIDSLYFESSFRFIEKIEIYRKDIEFS